MELQDLLLAKKLMDGGGGDKPTGTIEINQNGSVNVSKYAMANVSVPQGVFPEGSLNITENGTYDVTEKESVNVDVSGSEVYQIKDASYMFYYGTRKEEAENLYPQLQKIQKGSYLAAYLNNVVQTSSTDPLLYHLCQNIKLDNDYYNGVDLNNMFVGNTSQVYIDVTNFDTSNVIRMSSMFSGCKSLKHLIGINGFNTYKVTNMASMFSGCNMLGSTFNDDFQLQFNTSNVESFNSMFRSSGLSGYDNGIRVLDLSNFDFSKATNMSAMFSGGYSLRTIKLGKKDTNYQKVTDSAEIFAQCTRLEKVIINGTSILKLTASSCLTGVPLTCEFYVPDDLVDSYKAATNWSARAAYIFPISEYVEV